MPKRVHPSCKQGFQINVRFDAEAFARICLAAEDRHLTPTEWLRAVAREAVRAPHAPPLERLLLERVAHLELILYNALKDGLAAPKGKEAARALLRELEPIAERRAADLLVAAVSGGRP
jgi:hypothetical protein